MSGHQCPGSLDGCACCAHADHLRESLRRVANAIQVVGIAIGSTPERHDTLGDILELLRELADEMRVVADAAPGELVRS